MGQVFRARWVLPIVGPPLSGGWVAVDNGVIVAVGDGSARQPTGAAVSSFHVHTYPDAAILPGLVNAHVHLELSWMARQVPPADTMPAWASRLMALRRSVTSEPVAPIIEAIREIHESGTALLGEVTNTLTTYELLADSGLSAAVFRELLGFNILDPDQIIADTNAEIARLTPLAWLRPSIVPHAPYSVSAALLRAIAQASIRGPVSVHVGESSDELRFLRHGDGRWRDILVDLNVWTDEWRPPGCGPVEYLARLGLVNERLVAVHCVHLTDPELHALAKADATVVTCPRSNRWTGAGVPPIARFYEAGVRVAIGTDSLASVEDLQMFNEIAAARALAHGGSARRVLDSATRAGAVALGFGDELGTIEPGKRAALIAVAVPADVEDVEEYLVSGRVHPADIEWLETQCAPQPLRSLQ